MTAWLRALPHQYPFRATSSLRTSGERTVEGTFVASPDDGLFEGSAVSEVLVIEAMAQIAGALVFGDDGAPGFLSAIDDARFEGTIQAGDRIELAVQLDAGFGRIHRFSGVAMREGVEFAHARFYLAGPSDETT